MVHPKDEILLYVTLGDDETKNNELKFILIFSRKWNDKYLPKEQNWGRDAAARSHCGFRTLYKDIYL